MLTFCLFAISSIVEWVDRGSIIIFIAKIQIAVFPLLNTTIHCDPYHSTKHGRVSAFGILLAPMELLRCSPITPNFLN